MNARRTTPKGRTISVRENGLGGWHYAAVDMFSRVILSGEAATEAEAWAALEGVK